MATQTWAAIEGSIYGNAELSQSARMSPYYQMALFDAVEPASEFNIGKQSGDKVGFRIYGRVALGAAATALQETEKIPYGTLPTFHVSAQVFRRAFAMSWTGTREDLDRLDLENAIMKALTEHAARVNNKIIYDELVANYSFWYVALTSSTLGFGTNGTVSGTAAAAFSLFHLRKLKLKATQYNIPKFDGQNWLFIGSPNIEDGLNSDVAAQGFVDVAKYAPGGANGALQGEIGKVQQTRFVIDNTPEFADAIGSGSAFGSGFMLGEDAIKEVMVYPMHFRANMNVGDDFANQKGLAWQSMLDYVVPWNYTTHADARYIRYTSA